ncbi:DUF1345 domain-containing protein [Tabrizicola sp. J26]|uniref:DUF1345 domain-containing protein n=1 Tax=Alitabrizicola rongguiensis TaxID=2909234 RepID=UPI001F255677|nr:DUF1345 domain-containing protein [Tabrizicola rongguiensis]MCF1710851.1 DUF1345 domain-containing protein [Tabrizicola rongguiensis]
MTPTARPGVSEEDEFAMRLSRIPHYRFFSFLASLIVLTPVLAEVLAMPSAMLTAFDLSVALFILLCLPLFHSDAVPGRVENDDGGRLLLLLTTTIIVSVIVSAVGWMVIHKNNMSVQDFLLAAVSLLLGWTFINLIYAFHYAHLFYGPKKSPATSGLQFPGEEPPVFSDFCYFSFVIGMTCQVSDVVITRRHMRRVATVHGIIAFVFNLCVLALTVNVLSGVL